MSFVNYVNEICQRQRQTSIVRAVQQLGIPSWLVEIRHNASHSHVPPIETLRMAFAFCREWIWEHFWTHQPYEAMRSAGAVDTNSDVVAEEASLRDQKILNAIVAFALWRNKVGLNSLSRLRLL
nr:Las1 domain containing protein [Haemonchus contortus]